MSHFYPAHRASEPVFSGWWFVWNPATNALAATDEYFNLYRIDVLAGTGEMLFTGLDRSFPSCACGADMWPVPSVVKYVSVSGSSPWDAPVIYFNERYLQLDKARWVLDGEAALVMPVNENKGEWTLLYRDGAQRLISVPPASRFLAGTQNGWLALLDSPDGAELTLYTVEGAEVVITSLATVQTVWSVGVLDAPELGTSVSTGDAFPTVEPLPFSLSGDIRYDPRDYAGAEADYTAAIENGDDSPEIYYSRGLARFNRHDYTGAEADYTAAIERGDDSAEVHFARGRARSYLGNDASAETDYTAAIERGMDTPDVYRSRSIARYNQGDYAGATADLTAATERGD